MMKDDQPNVAVVGAGLAGLCCARQLRAAGLAVRVFDKGRGVGGRIATRRTDFGAVFDHGAQYFTVREEPLHRHVENWVTAGVVAPWQGRIGLLNSGQWTPPDTSTKCFVGVPTMTALPKYLAQDLDVVLHTRVATVASDGDSWRLLSEIDDDLGRFDVVILTAPAPQTARLIGDDSRFAQTMRTVKIAPCWAVMIAFDIKLPLPFDAAFVEESVLSWIARNSSKPGRAAIPDSWVLHASPEWSEEHIEDSDDLVTSEMLSAFWSATGATPQKYLIADAHRWRYASPREPLAERYVYDKGLGLGACGDWCGGPRVEGAFLSGLAMAEALIEDPR